MERRTKIVATIGPATRDPEVLARLVEAGMDVARLNFSHGTHEEHAETARLVREASSRAGRPVAILQDLPGPKMRIGPLEGDKAMLRGGDSVTFTTDVDGTQTGDGRADDRQLARPRRGARARRVGLPRRRLGAPARDRACAPATASSTARSSSAASSPRARA